MKTKTNTKEFLKDIFNNWYSTDTMKKAMFKELKQPSLLDYTALRKDVDSSKFGEYISKNTSSFKVKTIKLPDKLLYKSFDEIGTYLNKTYPGQLAGLDVMEHIWNNKDQYPDLKDGNYHFFFGSLFRYSDGRWRVPFVNGAGLDRDGYWLGHAWVSRYRVVLVETGLDIGLEPVADLTLKTLSLRLEKIERLFNEKLLK